MFTIDIICCKFKYFRYSLRLQSKEQLIGKKESIFTCTFAAHVRGRTLLDIWRNSAISKVAFRESADPVVVSSNIADSACRPLLHVNFINM